MTDIPALYAQFIQDVGDGTGMADSLLHVHAGLLILFLVRVVTGRSLSTPLPLAVVFVAEMANEVLDRLHYGSWRPADTISDIVNTMFWPTVLFVGLRLRRPTDKRAARLAEAATSPPEAR